MVAPTSVIDVFEGEQTSDGAAYWHQNFHAPMGVQLGTVLTETYDETGGSVSVFEQIPPKGTPVYADDGQFLWMVWGP